MSHSIECPHCRAVLKSAAPVPAGKTVKCPKCQKGFTIGDAEPKPAPPHVNDSISEDDEMAAAIAKLEAEQSAGKAPAPKAPQRPVPVVTPEIEVPEIDDELVLPDEEERPTKKKKSREVEDDESSSRKKKKPRDDEDEDDDKPRAKKKRSDDVEDEDDDKPRAKKKRSVDDEDDDDDRPRAKKKRTEADDEDEASAPRKKTKQKAGGGSMLIVGLVGGGLLVLLLCIGCGAGAYFFGGSVLAPNIVGKWENNDFIKLRYEFRADGTGTMDTIVRFDFRYTQQGNRLTILPSGMVGFGDIKVATSVETHYTVARDGDLLILRDERKGADIRLKKMP